MNALMATRQEIQQRRAAMREALIEECRNSSAATSTMLPPLHELSRRHGLSIPLISETIRELVNEGVLHTRRGAGTFVGRVDSSEETPSAPFLLLMSDDGSGAVHRASVRRGFEDRISQLGGSSLSLSVAAVRDLKEQGAVLPVAGIFDFIEWEEEEVLWPGDLDVPRVAFEQDSSSRPTADVIDFDNVGGGRLATEHLLRLGHKRIAYLGVHDVDQSRNDLAWSAQRAEGWKRALESAGCYSSQLFFTAPALANNSPEQERAGREASLEFIGAVTARSGSRSRAITAVVAANHITAHAVLEVLSESGLSSQLWPSIVAFDEQAAAAGQVISALRLPWEQIGTEAADILWQRNREPAGARTPINRLVPMKMISRLTCQPVWSSAPGAIALAMPRRRKVGTPARMTAAPG